MYKLNIWLVLGLLLTYLHVFGGEKIIIDEKDMEAINYMIDEGSYNENIAVKKFNEDIIYPSLADFTDLKATISEGNDLEITNSIEWTGYAEDGTEVSYLFYHVGGVDHLLERNGDGVQKSIPMLGPDNQANTPDDGVLMIYGDSKNPIIINGTNVVSNDVVIAGVYQGKGAIYSERNIHVVGDLTASFSPHWGKQGTTNSLIGGANGLANADFLSLNARGNVVLGDPQLVASSLAPTNELVVEPYGVLAGVHADIGYTDVYGSEDADGLWHGDYSAKDGGFRLESNIPAVGLEFIPVNHSFALAEHYDVSSLPGDYFVKNSDVVVKGVFGVSRNYFRANDLASDKRAGKFTEESLHGSYGGYFNLGVDIVGRQLNPDNVRGSVMQVKVGENAYAYLQVESVETEKIVIGYNGDGSPLFDEKIVGLSFTEGEITSFPGGFTEDEVSNYANKMEELGFKNSSSKSFLFNSMVVNTTNDKGKIVTVGTSNLLESLVPGVEVDGNDRFSGFTDFNAAYRFVDRHYYESNISDSILKNFMNRINSSGFVSRIDGFIFTNHFFGGSINQDLFVLNGTYCVNDFLFAPSASLSINQDIRSFLSAYPEIAVKYIGDWIKPTAVIKWGGGPDHVRMLTHDKFEYRD